MDQIVYLVEDDPLMRETLVDMLRSSDISVRDYESAHSFLNEYDPNLPGCLLLDLNMPDMNGLELQSELANRKVAIPIIFITGGGTIANTVQALKSGAFEFLEKPIKRAILLQRVNEAFDRASALQAEKLEKDSVVRRFNELTDREKDVLLLLTSGAVDLTSKQIAQQLGISHRTVEQYRARIMDKTKARSLTDLARMADIAGIDLPKTK